MAAGSTSGVGTVEWASSPKTKGDEVKLMFQLFDGDRDGKVTIRELKQVLQTLDKSVWTSERVEKVLAAYDGNGDGELQFTEFWGWVCGHGGKSTSDFKPALLDKAVEEDRARRMVAEEKMQRSAARKATREGEAAEKAQKEREREAGERFSQSDFVSLQMAVGLSEEVAQELFAHGDENADGDINKQERLWLAGEHAATTGQIRGLYQKGAGATDPKGNVSIKDCEDAGMRAIIQAFTSWDVDGDGSISAEELARVLHTLNPRLGPKTVEALSQEIDANKDGSIDIMEFVAWLSGEHTKKKQVKKKAKEEQEAKVAIAMHRRRAEEAKELQLQGEFEEARHKALQRWCAKKKMASTCHALMRGPGARQTCTSCGGRHAWLCHACGFVSFYEDCINGCGSSSHGWSCITGKCAKKCGCKKKPEYWQRAGCVGDLGSISLDVRRIIETSKVPEPSVGVATAEQH